MQRSNSEVTVHDKHERILLKQRFLSSSFLSLSSAISFQMFYERQDNGRLTSQLSWVGVMAGTFAVQVYRRKRLWTQFAFLCAQVVPREFLHEVFRISREAHNSQFSARAPKDLEMCASAIFAYAKYRCLILGYIGQFPSVFPDLLMHCIPLKGK